MAMELNKDLNATRGITTFKIPLDKVAVKPGFNRRFGDPDRAVFERLKGLIRLQGQRVPAEVWVQPDRTVILASGHQRYKALLDLEGEDPQGRTLLCIPFTGNEEKAKLNSITENLGQTGTSLMDNVFNWDYLINVLGKPVAEVATMYNVSPASITEGCKLLELDKEHQQLVHKGKLTAAMAKRLAKHDPAARKLLLEETFRVAEERISKAKAASDVVKGLDTPLEGVEQSLESPDAGTGTPDDGLSIGFVSTTEELDGRVAEAEMGDELRAADAPKGPKKRTTKKAVESDMAKAAENLGLPGAAEAPRKLKEINTFFDEFIAETPSCPAVDLVKDFQRWQLRKLTDAQWNNRLMKYTGSVLGEVITEATKKGRGGKK